MQKSSFLPNSQEVPVVEFSKLDENNKAQFLQFLIKNNITFDNAAGKQNVVAKVTLKTLTPNKNVTNKTSNISNVKTGNKKVAQQKTNNNKYQDKQNNQNFHANKKTTNNNKTPLKNQVNQINQKKTTEAASSFKKLKPVQRQNQKSRKLPQNIRGSSISLKSQQNKQNKKGQTMNIQLRQRTPDRKNQTLISPVKSGRKMNEKSSEKLISIKDSNISPAKSVKNVSFTKQSHQRLSNFKKQNIPKTMRQSSVLQQSRGPIYIAKQSSVNKREKVRNKALVQIKLSDSRESLNFSRQKIGNSNPLRNQSYESLNRIQLVNKYKQYFNNFNSGNSLKSATNSCVRQRPICWPLTQIEKLLDQFYDDNFIKNTNQILNGSKRLNESLKKGTNSKTSHLAQGLEKFLNRKFNKVQKAIQYNLINFLYSVAFYINEFKEINNQQENGSIIELVLFQDFLSQKFELEDYLFFLFCRNILKQDFKKSFVSSSSTININKKQIDRFLKHIVGQNNTEILEEYHQMIFEKVPNYQIEINKFMRILIDDYKIKREAAEQSHREKIRNEKNLKENCFDNQQFLCDEDSSLENTFNKILCLDNRNDPKGNIFQNSGQLMRQDSMQELTFGQDTKDMLRQVDIETKNYEQEQIDLQFWQSPYINEKNTKAQKQRLLKDDFNQMIAQKLCQKTHQLVELLSTTVTTTNEFYHRSKKNYQMQGKQFESENNDTQQQNEFQQIEQLLFSKALCLFFTVIEMNKVKWLKELYIRNPTQEDIEKVQEIQLFFRKIKEFPSAKDIAEFCKLILTVSQITEELSRFFV